MKNYGISAASDWNKRAKPLPGKHLSRLILLAVMFMTAMAFMLLKPAASFAQRKCGAEGQRPCKIWERLPSCNKGLREHFRLNMCVGARTQVDAYSGKYIPRKTMTTVQLCNKSTRPMIYSAIAQWIGHESGWVTRGWFKIPAGRCDSVQLDYEYRGAVYIYGSAPDSTEWDGPDATFCVKTYDSFEIDNSDNLECNSRDYSIVGMQKLDVKPGKNTWNFAD